MELSKSESKTEDIRGTKFVETIMIDKDLEHLTDAYGGESVCCGARMIGDICSDCKEHSEEYVCEYCEGTGVVTTMETVWPGEPHQAPVGERPCSCQE